MCCWAATQALDSLTRGKERELAKMQKKVGVRAYAHVCTCGRACRLCVRARVRVVGVVGMFQGGGGKGGWDVCAVCVCVGGGEGFCAR